MFPKIKSWWRGGVCSEDSGGFKQCTKLVSFKREPYVSNRENLNMCEVGGGQGEEVEVIKYKAKLLFQHSPTFHSHHLTPPIPQLFKHIANLPTLNFPQHQMWEARDPRGKVGNWRGKLFNG